MNQIEITPEFLESNQFSKTFTARFWRRVSKDGALVKSEIGRCWQWTGGTVEGYGYMCKGSLKSGMILAHRASWILHIGPIPDGKWVLHKCDNRACPNPEHLFLGTNQENISDMIQKGRNPRGDTHKSSKLTSVEVAEIRSLYSSGSMTQKAIGKQFGVARRTICHVINDTWKSVTATDEQRDGDQ